jgi:hypothetical protein
MARRRNYGFERRQKETLRQARQEAKRGRKAERLDAGASGPEMGDAQEAGAPAGQWEWFSPSRSRVVATAPRQRPPAEEPNDWVLLTEVGESEADESGPSES